MIYFLPIMWFSLIFCPLLHSSSCVFLFKPGNILQLSCIYFNLFLPSFLSLSISITVCVCHFVSATYLVFRGLKDFVMRRRCLRALNRPVVVQQRKELWLQTTSARVRRSAPLRPSCRWWRRIQTMTTQARRRTFTTNHRRGSAGSRTLNPTIITRADPSGSLGDDPSFWRTPHPPSWHTQPPPTHRQTPHSRCYKDWTHPEGVHNTPRYRTVWRKLQQSWTNVPSVWDVFVYNTFYYFVSTQS